MVKLYLKHHMAAYSPDFFYFKFSHSFNINKYYIYIFYEELLGYFLKITKK